MATQRLTTLFHNQNRIRESRVDMAFMIANYSILVVFLLAVLYPLIFVTVRVRTAITKTKHRRSQNDEFAEQSRL